MNSCDVRAVQENSIPMEYKYLKIGLKLSDQFNGTTLKLDLCKGLQQHIMSRFAIYCLIPSELYAECVR